MDPAKKSIFQRPSKNMGSAKKKVFFIGLPKTWAQQNKVFSQEFCTNLDLLTSHNDWVFFLKEKFRLF